MKKLLLAAMLVVAIAYTGFAKESSDSDSGGIGSKCMFETVDFVGNWNLLYKAEGETLWRLMQFEQIESVYGKNYVTGQLVTEGTPIGFGSAAIDGDCGFFVHVVLGNGDWFYFDAEPEMVEIDMIKGTANFREYGTLPVEEYGIFKMFRAETDYEAIEGNWQYTYFGIDGDENGQFSIEYDGVVTGEQIDAIVIKTEIGWQMIGWLHDEIFNAELVDDEWQADIMLAVREEEESEEETEDSTQQSSTVTNIERYYEDDGCFINSIK